MDKKELRHKMRAQNRALSEEQRLEAGRLICLKIEELPTFRDAQCVGFFASLPDEPTTHEFFGRWAASRRVVLPRVEGDEMNFYEFSPQTMTEGAFGIWEPTLEARPCDVAEIDLLIVPGVAFTLGGDRMGRGKGYYDKYLSRKGFRAVKIGVCFRHQIVDELPTEPHDVRMDGVVSD